jgi:hypothetical protein
VRPCGTCDFFWPQNPARQPYGPYPAYDFSANTPTLRAPQGNPVSFPWLKATTRPGSFPDAEIMDGCRKAPIMTIGINPNLTAFLPGNTGAAWCYPSFSGNASTDSWTKYAYYYRYRSVYQERFDPKFIQQFLLTDGRIVAPKPGTIESADRPSDAPTWSISVRYDGDAQDTSIALPGRQGEPRYVLLIDPRPPNNRFRAGELLAARLSVPQGRETQLYAQQIGYYERMVPVLARFEAFLQSRGHPGAHLRVGEDVCQLDMVACASPHWGPAWLGGSNASVRSIISNCVSKNAWAMRQLVQTRPAVLLLIGEATYTMFRHAFGAFIRGDPALPPAPEDGAFSLLRATTDPAHPCRFEFSDTVDGQPYSISTRLIVAPHFSYQSNFLPQLRLREAQWAQLQHSFPQLTHFLQHDQRLRQLPATSPGGFIALQIAVEADQVLAHLKKTWPGAERTLMSSYYDPEAMIAGVLEDLYTHGQLKFINATPKQPGVLTRSDGPCSFCVNRHWHFPLGCPYGKPDEKPLAPGLLEKIADTLARTGAPALPDSAAHRMLDDAFEAKRSP